MSSPPLAGETRGTYAATPITLQAEGHELLAFPPSKTASAHPIAWAGGKD